MDLCTFLDGVEIQKLEYEPVKMTTKFTSTETKIAAKSMENNKSCGIEQMYAEHVKYAPECVHTEIAEIFNKTTSPGNEDHKNPHL